MFVIISLGIFIAENQTNMETANTQGAQQPRHTREQYYNALTQIISELKQIKATMVALCQAGEAEDQWLNLEELRNYLPNHPAEQTVYGWTSTHAIPFHKKGKHLQFLKSEIDNWLKADNHQ